MSSLYHHHPADDRHDEQRRAALSAAMRQPRDPRHVDPRHQTPARVKDFLDQFVHGDHTYIAFDSIHGKDNPVHEIRGGKSKEQRYRYMAFLLRTRGGSSYFVKWDAGPAAVFESEAMGLAALREFASPPLRVPKLIGPGGVGDMGQSGAFLLLDYHDMLPGLPDGAQFRAGQMLAQAHSASQRRAENISSRTPRYGFEVDNRISCAVLQPNQWRTDWCDFFFENRINSALEAALEKDENDGDEDNGSNNKKKRSKNHRQTTSRNVDEGSKIRNGKREQKQTNTLFRSLAHQIMQSRKQLQEYFFEGLDAEMLKPALLHGEVWPGNVSLTTTPNEQDYEDDHHAPIYFDAAPFWGHSEFDLALTQTFPGLSDAFFQGYHSERARQGPKFAQRQQLYELYHLLVSLVHFGELYRDRCVQRMEWCLEQIIACMPNSKGRANVNGLTAQQTDVDF